MTAESKQVWKNRECKSEVCMCGVSTQQWPSTQITLLERTRQSAWLDAIAILVDKKRVNLWQNSCTKAPLFLRDFSNKKIENTPRKCFSDALLMSRFPNNAPGASKIKTVRRKSRSRGYNSFVMTVPFTPWNSNLVPLIEGLCSSNPCIWVLGYWRPESN